MKILIKRGSERDSNAWPTAWWPETLSTAFESLDFNHSQSMWNNFFRAIQNVPPCPNWLIWAIISESTFSITTSSFFSFLELFRIFFVPEILLDVFMKSRRKLKSWNKRILAFSKIVQFTLNPLSYQKFRLESHENRKIQLDNYLISSILEEFQRYL